MCGEEDKKQGVREI